MSDQTTIFRTHVPRRRLQRAERILHKLGLSTAEAVNMLLAQIELRQGLPFDVRMTSKPILSANEQAAEWTEAFGAY
jgi:DNA-damage-inducible protein J